MTDVDDELRDLFQRKAFEVPPHTQVPPSLRARSRRRMALNGFVAVVAVVALGGAAVGTLRLVNGGRTMPGHDGEAPKPSGSASGAVAACTAAQLRADASLGGAMGSVEGGILVTNTSSRTCTLEGYPGFLLFDADHVQIQGGFQIQPTKPQWNADAKPKPAGWPVVTLEPGGVAAVRFRWTNWCETGAQAVPIWTISIPGSGTDTVYGMDSMSPPPCNGPSFPSTIYVGPFEPGTDIRQ